jgi:hypothetical protein
MLITASSLVFKEKSITSSALDDELVLLNVDTGDYYTLNKTGSFIWGLLEQTPEVSKLIDLTAQKFAIEHEKACNDILVLLNNLASEKLINIQ